MLKYIFITAEASEAIASDKTMQSIESYDGFLLASYLTSQTTEAPARLNCHFKMTSDGIFIKGNENNPNRVLVIDVEQSNLFSGFDEQSVLTIFQKTLRFSIKYWENLHFSSYERNIQNSSKSVIFPFPISSQSSFRLVFERDPDPKRASKRHCNYLLLYKSGVKDGDSANEVASLTNFKKAIASFPTIDFIITDRQPRADQATVPFSVVELEEIRSKSILLLPFDQCMRFATKSQKDFISADYRSVQRLEGPAGTGKSFCLRLRAIKTLLDAQKENREHHCLYIVPSEELCKQTQQIFMVNDECKFLNKDRNDSPQSIQIMTLQALCANILGTEISPSEFLDVDSMESKTTQLIYIFEILKEFKDNDFETFKPSLSDEFSNQFAEDNLWDLAELFQHEISYIIKGRARMNFQKYKSIERNWQGLPLKNEADISTSYMLFSKYQEKLEATSQFDIDDIVISATQQLEAPIWQRRRKKYGYDSILIDEIHLFNMNELSVFHSLIKNDEEFNFSYAIDSAQSIGDTGWSQESFDEALRLDDKKENNTPITTIFRSSPQIIELAFSITASGSTLFTSFKNPLQKYIGSFTFDEEQKCSKPVYWNCENDEKMIKHLFYRAEEINKKLSCGKGDILIVSFDELLWREIKKYSENHNKPIATLTKRGDFNLVKSAQQYSRFVLSLPEYIGGLEFSAVLLAGIDKGRVPQTNEQQPNESSLYLNYAAHNKLYIAVTRSKYVVELFGSRINGPSNLLSNAISSQILNIIDQ